MLYHIKYDHRETIVEILMRPSLFAATSLAIASSSLAQAEVPRVVTDITPIGSLVAQVMNGLGKPDVLVPQTGSPHGFALKPSQAADLQAADVVVWVGEGLSPWLEGPLSALARKARIVELAEQAAVELPYREGAVFAADDDHAEQDHEGHDHEGHDHEKESHDAQDHGKQDHSEHDHSGLDPHLWLDPRNGAVWLGVIAEALSAADPENSALYQSNAAQAQAKLMALDTEIAAQLAPFKDAPFVVFHDAYQYFSARYDLTTLGSISVSDASPPSAARLAALQEAIKAQNVQCIFSEPQFDPRLVAAIGGKVSVAELDPLGAKIAFGPDHYADTLRAMTTSVAGCLAP